MVLYYATLLLIVLLGIGVLSMVALVAAGARRADQTRLSSRMGTIVKHLNGDAEPPRLIADLLTPAAKRPEKRQQEADAGAERIAEVARPSAVARIARIVGGRSRNLPEVKTPESARERSLAA